jgi:hypothetical protein
VAGAFVGKAGLGVGAFVVDALPGGGRFDGHRGVLGAGVGRLLPVRLQPGALLGGVGRGPASSVSR